MNEPSASSGVDWEAAYAYLEEQQESILLRFAEKLEQLERSEQEPRAAATVRIRGVDLHTLGQGVLRSIVVADGGLLTYGFHVFRDGRLVREQAFGPSNTLQWQPAKAGSYRVRGLVRSGEGDEPPQAADSSVVVVPAWEVSG